MKDGWDSPLTDWVNDIKKDANSEILRLSKKIFLKIKERTPVVSGRLKAGWILQELITDGVLATTISNNVEYVGFVEYGTDKFEGRYMVEQTLNEMLEGTIK